MFSKFGNRISLIAVGVGMALGLSQPAQAFQFEKGDLNGSWDTTVSYGQSWRAGGLDRSIVGRGMDLPAPLSPAPLSNGFTGVANSENGDDGDQNFRKGKISDVLKFTSEIELNYHNFGGFFRFNGFRDGRNEDAGDHTPLTNAAKRLTVHNINIQDAYLWSRFDVGSMPAQVRVGEQVLSWGESTFIQNGINIINPFDVSKLRTPGSEIRDALRPVGMVSASIAPTDSTTVEAFYEYDYERTLLEPTGTFFSTNDFAGEGGQKVMLGFGAIPDSGFSFEALGAGLTGAINADLAALGQPAQALFDANFLAVSRAGDNRPKEGGQFGISLKYFSEALNNTEFGLYFVNYHSRVPLISANTGTAAGVASGATAFAAVCPAPTPGCAGAVTAGAAGATAAFQAATLLAIDRYAKTASYQIEYPEDIQVYGLSFNTTLGASGIALQGEYSLHHDAPLQVDDVELLFAALTPLTNAGLPFAYAINQLGSFGTNTHIPGFIKRDVSQFQVTATQVFGPTLKANTAVLVGEVGVTYVHNMPDKSVLRLESPGTFTTGNPIHASGPSLALPLGGGHSGLPAEGLSHFADQASWGYRIAGRLTYNNFIGPVNVLPHFAWSHDVAGNTPGPGGSFLAGRKAITVGVGFDYQSDWQADISYTNFFGAGSHNLLNDRDFVAFNLKYSF